MRRRQLTTLVACNFGSKFILIALIPIVFIPISILSLLSLFEQMLLFAIVVFLTARKIASLARQTSSLNKAAETG
jgi:hypothetical protein